MINKKLKMIARLAVIFVVVSLVCCISCAAPEPTPPTPTPPTPTPPTPAPPAPTVESFRISVIDDFSGPYAVTIEAFYLGFQDYFADLNEKGGIDGIPVEILWADTGGDASKAVSAFRRFMSGDNPPLISQCNISTHQIAIKPLLEEYKIANMGTGGSPAIHFPPGNCYAPNPCYPDGAGGALNWIVDDWAANGKTGNPKVGFFVWDNALGRGFLPGIDYAKDANLPIDIVKTEFMLPTDVDISAQVSSLKKSGADYIIFGQPLSSHMAMLCKELARQKYDAVPIGMSAALNTLAVSLAEGTAEGAVGFCTAAGCSSWEAEGIEAAEICRALSLKYRGKYEGIDEYYFSGFAHGLIITEAFRLALEKVEPDELTAEILMEQGMNRIKGFSTKGAHPGEEDFTNPNERRGSMATYHTNVKDGKVIIVDIVILPDITGEYYKPT